jgi:hypothetical protein
VDTSGNAAKREETPWQDGAAKQRKEGRREDSEEGRTHEGMNPTRKGRGTVGEAQSVAEAGNGGRDALREPNNPRTPLTYNALQPSEPHGRYARKASKTIVLGHPIPTAFPA